MISKSIHKIFGARSYKRKDSILHIFALGDS